MCCRASSRLLVFFVSLAPFGRAGGQGHCEASRVFQELSALHSRIARYAHAVLRGLHFDASGYPLFRWPAQRRNHRFLLPLLGQA
jgi:hypothetical protein